jgi:hypothetical protein
MNVAETAVRFRLLRNLMLLVPPLATGASVANSFHAYSVEYVLLAVAGISACVGLIYLLILKKRADSYVRETQAVQQASLDRAFRAGMR